MARVNVSEQRQSSDSMPRCLSSCPTDDRGVTPPKVGTVVKKTAKDSPTDSHLSGLHYAEGVKSAEAEEFDQLAERDRVWLAEKRVTTARPSTPPVTCTIAHGALAHFI